LVQNRQQAQAAVLAGRVLVGGSLADKPARLVGADQAVVLQGDGPRFVSRGGEKLDAALERFELTVVGRRALDAGASTGGFTDCLLRHGAAHVYAVDVGYGQLDASLRSDPRVTVRERLNVRLLTPADLEDGDASFVPVDLVTADLSFISLTVVVPVLAGPVLRVGGDLVVLVKPQFEAGRAAVSKGKGVVRDPQLWRQALDTVASALEGAGTGIMGAMASPVAGPAGNIEFLLHARQGSGGDADACRTWLDGAVAEGQAMALQEA
jgi:23S rRNA (cytidine1920-2'-O)/16S rRNA (cytidine1409-2'-O)-methyltransferase